MARIEEIERRLLNWARWKLNTAGGNLGYAGVDLQQAGMPRDPYAEAPIPTNEIEASDTDDAVDRLPSELKATVQQYYLGRGGEREHLAALCCARQTLYARIDRSHRLLAEHFHARRERQDRERERLEALRRAAQA